MKLPGSQELWRTYGFCLLKMIATSGNRFHTVLTNTGYEVIEASDGHTGVILYRQKPCDRIITDIFMPKEDGIETIFSLKAETPGVKIIAISGGDNWSPYSTSVGPDEPLEMAQRFGADRIIKKPVKLRQLLALVDELLNVKSRLYAE